MILKQDPNAGNSCVAECRRLKAPTVSGTSGHEDKMPMALIDSQVRTSYQYSTVTLDLGRIVVEL